MPQPADADEAEQKAVALEIVRREAIRSGRSIRSALTVVRVSNPPTRSEELLLAAVRLLKSPHAIMPHKCPTVDEWLARYTQLSP